MSVWYENLKVLKFVEFLWCLCSNLSYHNDLQFSGRQTWVSDVFPDLTAPDQGLHCLPFILHLLDTLQYGTTKFRMITAFLGV